MSQRGNYFKIGAFVLSGVAILVAGLIVLGAGKLFEKGVLVETYLDESVQGLDVGSPIKYRGVQIGTVKEIALVSKYYRDASPRYRRYVLVRGELTQQSEGSADGRSFEDRVLGEIAEGMRVRLASQGITGLAYIEIDYLNPATYTPLDINWKPEVLYVPSAPSRLTQIADSIEKVAIGLEDSNVKEIADKIDNLIETITRSVEDAKVNDLSDRSIAFLDEMRETNKRLQSILERPEIDEIPRDMAATMQNVNRVMDASDENVIALIEDLRETSAQLQGMSEKMSEFMQSDQFKTGIDDFAATAKNAREATARIPETADSLNRSVRRLEILIARQQHDIDAIVENMRAITENLGEMSENTREHPSLLLFGDPPKPLEK